MATVCEAVALFIDSAITRYPSYMRRITDIRCKREQVSRLWRSMYLPATKFHIVTVDFLVSLFNLAACSNYKKFYILYVY